MCTLKYDVSFSVLLQCRTLMRLVLNLSDIQSHALRSEPNETEYMGDDAMSDENTELKPSPKRRKVMIHASLSGVLFRIGSALVDSGP